jgi:hypothetical protein
MTLAWLGMAAQQPTWLEVPLPQQVSPGNTAALQTDVRGFMGLANGGRLLEYHHGQWTDQLPDSLAQGELVALYKSDSAGFAAAYREGWVVWKRSPELGIYRWRGDAPVAVVRRNEQVAFFTARGDLGILHRGEVALHQLPWVVFDATLHRDTCYVATDDGVWKFHLNQPQRHLRHAPVPAGSIVRDVDWGPLGLVAALYSGQAWVGPRALELPAGETRQVVALGNGFLWLNEAGNLYQINQTATNWIPPTGGRALRMEVDHEGQLWVATPGGVYRTPLYLGLLELKSPVTALVQHRSKVYLAVGNSLQIRNAQWELVSVEQLPAPVMALAVHADAVYAGTLGLGLFRAQGNGWLKVPLQNANVLSLKSFRNDLYIGTLGGIYRLHPRGTDLIPSIPGLPQPYAYDMAAYRDTLYAGTDGAGVVAIFPQGLSPGFSTPGDSVIVDLEVTPNGLWALAFNGYLTQYKGATASFKSPHSEQFFSVKTMGNGLIMCLGNKGLHLLSVSKSRWAFLDVLRHAPGWIPELHAAEWMPAGTLAVGTQRGVVFLDTAAMPRVWNPGIYLRQARVGSHPFDGGRLKHDQNAISLSLSTGWNLEARQMAYQVQLRGWDAAPYTTSESRFFYGNLPPGEYAFVAAPILEGFTDPEPAVLLRFVIERPLWQRWWFLALGVVALGWGLWAYFRWREGSIKRSQALQQALVEARYEALRSQVNPHFLFNSFNTLLALIETDPRRASGYLTGLSRFFRGILQRREQAVATLGEELQLLEEYLGLQKTRFEEALVFENAIEVRWMNHLLPPLALQQLVENALKHNAFTAQQPLVISLSVRQGILRVQNTYRPLQPSDAVGTGFGLQSLRKQLEALVQQPLVVDSNEQYFWVEIPLLSPP